MNIYPADFDDEDVQDPEELSLIYRSFLTSLSAFTTIDANDVLQPLSPGEVERNGLLNINFPAEALGSIFTICIVSTREKLESLLQVAEIYERNVLQELDAKMKDGVVNITMKRSSNPDMYSKQNLLVSLRISKHAKKVISAARHFLENEK